MQRNRSGKALDLLCLDPTVQDLAQARRDIVELIVAARRMIEQA